MEAAGNARSPPAARLGLAVIAVLLVCGAATEVSESEDLRDKFVTVSGVQLVVDGKPFYVNGWNSYWLMAKAAERAFELQGSGSNLESGWEKAGALEEVKQVLEHGSKLGMTVCRTWAFSDGGYHALQMAPGRYDDVVFKALDYVVAEARNHNVKLILCLVDDLASFGGKPQYVKWAVEAGHHLSRPSNDSFYSDNFIKNYYKRYVMTVLTRVNTVTGVAYRDDPTILAWELVNEPRCASDPTGHTLKAWIKEMAAYVKMLDSKHLVTVGMEGFYSGANGVTLNRLGANPAGGWAQWLGTDFIDQNKLEHIDFASAHGYPDTWVPFLAPAERLDFFNNWIDVHIEDAQQQLGKPVLFSEFGISSEMKDFEPESRHRLLTSMFQKVWESAKAGRAGAGSLVWQFVAPNMNRLIDSFSIVPTRHQHVAELFSAHSCRLLTVQNPLHAQACARLEQDKAH